MEIEGIKDYIHKQDSFHHINGVVSIERDNDILYREAFGLANIEHHVPNTLDTKFMLGSNTKLFTTIAVFQLIEEGLLSLEAPVSRFFTGHGKLINDTITIHHLLSHTGGIKDFFAMEGGDDIQYVEIPREKLLAMIFSESPQVPGEYLYSNAGFYLLGLIIELLSGKSYADYVSDNIFRPLGMEDTGVYDQKSIVKKIAFGYKLKEGSLTTALYFAMEKFYAAGGIYSTLDDLAKWLKGLAGNQLVSSASFQKISSPVKGKYGYGCRLGETRGAPYIWHDGFIKGHYSHIRLYPTRNMRMMILRNSSALSSHVADELDPDGVCSYIAVELIF